MSFFSGNFKSSVAVVLLLMAVLFSVQSFSGESAVYPGPDEVTILERDIVKAKKVVGAVYSTYESSKQQPIWLKFTAEGNNKKILILESVKQGESWRSRSSESLVITEDLIFLDLATGVIYMKGEYGYLVLGYWVQHPKGFRNATSLVSTLSNYRPPAPAGHYLKVFGSEVTTFSLFHEVAAELDSIFQIKFNSPIEKSWSRMSNSLWIEPGSGGLGSRSCKGITKGKKILL